LKRTLPDKEKEKMNQHASSSIDIFVSFHLSLKKKKIPTAFGRRRHHAPSSSSRPIQSRSSDFPVMVGGNPFFSWAPVGFISRVLRL
jgi:hypothetical protein